MNLLFDLLAVVGVVCLIHLLVSRVRQSARRINSDKLYGQLKGRIYALKSRPSGLVTWEDLKDDLRRYFNRGDLVESDFRKLFCENEADFSYLRGVLNAKVNFLKGQKANPSMGFDSWHSMLAVEYWLDFREVRSVNESLAQWAQATYERLFVKKLRELIGSGAEEDFLEAEAIRIQFLSVSGFQYADFERVVENDNLLDLWHEAVFTHIKDPGPDLIHGLNRLDKRDIERLWERAESGDWISGRILRYLEEEVDSEALEDYVYAKGLSSLRVFSQPSDGDDDRLERLIEESQ